MDVSYLQNTRSPYHPPPYYPLLSDSWVSISLSKKSKNVKSYSVGTKMCLASNSDTMVAGKMNKERKSSGILGLKNDEEYGDLKSWMHRNGLPPCKVVLKERSSHDSNHRPIHYVAASEDLQVNESRLSL